VLRTVRTEGEGRTPFVPQLSVTTAFALALLSVLALVLFLAHLASEIRVETALRTVHAEATRTVQRALGPHDAATGAVRAPAVPPGAQPVRARESGFQVDVDEPALLAAATAADAVVLLHAVPGSSVVAGTPVGAAWSRPGGPLPGAQDLQGQVAAAVVTGHERTAAHDVAFGLRQLVDVAVKALSPGINDPTTAVHALGHCSALLCELAGRDLGPRLLHDADGAVRVVLLRPSLADLLELAVGQPRRYGGGDPLVLGRLAALLQELAWSVPPEERPVVAEQLARLRRTAGQQDLDPVERARFDRAAAGVEDALAGRWRSDRGVGGVDEPADATRRLAGCCVHRRGGAALLQRVPVPQQAPRGQ
jgi:uncharacterized membrane protein